MTADFLNNITGALRFATYSELVEELYVKALIESFERVISIPEISKKTENEIRNHLAYDLENFNQLLSPFFQIKLLKLTKENTILVKPTETRRTDIEFFISGHGDFIVECKNLQSADQRYVDNGVIRFVNEVYAKNDAEAAMIGFVVGGKINSIITNLKARVSQQSSYIKTYSHPTEKCAGYEFSFHSSHSRVNASAIILHHLFIDLIPKVSKN